MGRTKLSSIFIFMYVIKCSAISYNELEDFAEYLTKTSQLSPTLKKDVSPDDYDEDEVVSDHAWEDSGKFEGDLVLNERQRRLIVQTVAEGLSRNGLRDSTKRWPNNEVIYYIQVEHFTNDQVQAIQSGIDDLARASCIQFRPYRKGDRDAVVIQGSRRGCFSQVGYQGGYQVLNLSGRHPIGRGCFRHGTVVHELLHTLGFYHMQSSPDRDDYVDVIWDNILKQAKHNFRKYNLFSVSDFGVGYDYDSVLHYSRRAFSANGQDTIVPKQRGAQIGQRVGLSDKDTEKLNKMYCDANSDNVPANDDATKDKKKKTAKNKPFEGHGIGYHQGKAVVIKLSPEAETYKLSGVQSSHLFDYFSKTPQILSTEQQGFRADKKITNFYNPSGAVITQNHKGPADYNIEDEVTQLHNKEKDSYSRYHHSDHQIADDKDEMGHSNVQRPTVERNEKSSNGEIDDSQDPSFIDAIDRISKIIKSRVYPSQTPDLSIYKKYERYTKHENDKQEVKKNKNDVSVSPTPFSYHIPHTDKLQSVVRLINNLFDLDYYQNDVLLEDTAAKSNNYYNKEPRENKGPEIGTGDDNTEKKYYLDNGQHDKEDSILSPLDTHTDGYNQNTKYNRYSSLQNEPKKVHDSRTVIKDRQHSEKSYPVLYVGAPYMDYVGREGSVYNNDENIFSSLAPTRFTEYSYES